MDRLETIIRRKLNTALNSLVRDIGAGGIGYSIHRSCCANIRHDINESAIGFKLSDDEAEDLIGEVNALDRMVQEALVQ